MSGIDKLRRLLDGEVDAEEIANDPTLASIAERVYGVNIEPLKLSKPSQMTGAASAPSQTSSSTKFESQMDLMIEVVEGGPSLLPNPGVMSKEGLPAIAPLPGITPIVKPVMADTPSGFGKMQMGVVGLLIVEIANLFGLFGALFGDVCSDGLCPDDGRTRINILSIGRINDGYGWSEPLQAGSIGIPDIVLVLGLVALSVLLYKRR